MKFIKGMDISMVKELEQYGASYRLNGKKEDLFAILKTCGTNNVRIRIWPDPYDENGNSYGEVEMIWRLPLRSQKELYKAVWILCLISIIVISGQTRPNR